MQRISGHMIALAALLLAPSGCVVPIGPEWSDPQPNTPPTIATATPPVGTILDTSAGGNLPMGLQVVLSDQNTQDILYVRWIVDYPPYVDGISVVSLEVRQPGGDQIQRPPINFAPSCTDNTISRVSPDHRLLLAVSDRPFVVDNSGQSRLDWTDGNFLVEGAWDFSLYCQ